MDEIVAKLNEIVGKKLKGKTVDLNTDLSTLGFDSLDKAEIIINIEDQFEIEFSEDEMLSVKTLADLVKMIDEKTND